MPHCRLRFVSALCLIAVAFVTPAGAASGDPQIRTDHPWYQGELSCSTYPRLFRTQADLFESTVGRPVKTDEDKALASWIWRTAHYYHGEDGAENLWGGGYGKGGDPKNREYWSGLYAHGFSLCGTTHAQWVAEIQELLGHNRARTVGVQGHNSFEVFLTGGKYGDGKWVLLDHDVCTVIFDKSGSQLLSIREVMADQKKLTDFKYLPVKQHGFPVCGLHAGDGGVFRQFNVAEYLAGYTGAPPLVRLRRGETMRRYLEPGLDDGKTFVFWGRNYNAAGVPGPERSLTWVNQPEKLLGAGKPVSHKQGQARYGNAVFTYRPDFKSDDYREGVIAETDGSLTFEFSSPYIIGSTPANEAAWGVYDDGGKNGLVLQGKANCDVSVSVDRGRTWHKGGKLVDGLDLTDHVKGYRQYYLRFETGAKQLRDSNLVIKTVCQASSSVMPRLKDGGASVQFAASQQGVVSAGPTREQGRTHIVAGNFDTPKVTLELKTPRGERIVGVHAVAQVASSNPPRPDVAYFIEYSTDEGKTWKPIVKDWSITRRGDEPKDFWSQSFVWGNTELKEKASAVQVRFRNNGGKTYLRCEAHLVYAEPKPDATRVTFGWTERGEEKTATKVFSATAKETDPAWKIATGTGVTTRWVEMSPEQIK